MKDRLIWGLFLAIFLYIFIFISFYAKFEPAGDIVEYYGVTESILNHGSIDLSLQDRKNLEKVLNPGQFNDPNYYIKGKDGQRYPGHFIFYSLLAVPVRLMLRVIHIDEVKTLAVTNLLIIFLSSYFIMRMFLPSTFKKGIFLVCLFLSPLLSFIVWPGPDLFYVCMLLLAIFFFFDSFTSSVCRQGREKSLIKGLPSEVSLRLFWAILFTTLASWHSQPIIIIALSFYFYYLYLDAIKYHNGKIDLYIKGRTLLYTLLFTILAFLPYVYNYLIFGVLTPWAVFKDIWTQFYGFGFQNASLKKLFEQFFDPNIGLFWYAPVIFISGFYFMFKEIGEKRKSILIVLLIITAFFYQTNPAWHYGTSGYGPTRHILFALPFLIYYIVKSLNQNTKGYLLLSLIFISQVFILSLNGFIAPKFSNSLHHSPYAVFILDNFPRLYNPTPEIFVDRTNHTDLKHITSAIYRSNDICKKAYVLKSDTGFLKKECGHIPVEYGEKLIDEYQVKTDFSRKTRTIEATFWPDPESCSDSFVATEEKPYLCMRSLEDVVKYTGVNDKNRFTKLEEYPYPGIWKLKRGDVVEVVIPPGYIVQQYLFEGTYVDY